MADGLYAATPEQKLLVNLSNAKNVKTREAFRIYIIANRAVYKIFLKRDKAATLEEEMLGAQNAELPVAKIKPVYKAKLIEDGKANDVYVLEMEYLKGEFFQLAKPGHVTILANHIGTSPVLRGRVRRIFKTAKAFGLTDPQGFFDFSATVPIHFIDVHHSSTPALQLQEVINAIPPT